MNEDTNDLPVDVPKYEWDEAVFAANIRATGKAVLLAMSSVCDYKTGKHCKQSTITVAEKAGASIRHTKRTIAWAVENGWLVPTGSGMKNVKEYALAIPATQASSATEGSSANSVVPTEAASSAIQASSSAVLASSSGIQAVSSAMVSPNTIDTTKNIKKTTDTSETVAGAPVFVSKEVESKGSPNCPSSLPTNDNPSLEPEETDTPNGLAPFTAAQAPGEEPDAVQTFLLDVDEADRPFALWVVQTEQVYPDRTAESRARDVAWLWDTGKFEHLRADYEAAMAGAA